MNKFTGPLAAAIVALSAGMSVAATYNFKEAGHAGNTIGATLGESIWDPFDTSTLGVGGPNIRITAGYLDPVPVVVPTDITTSTAGFQSAYVYLDHGNAGMGVCKTPTSQSHVNVAYTGTTNRCDPSSDDGITGITEVLFFQALDQSVRIDSIWMNANHDSPDIRDAVYRINGTEYDSSDMIDDPVLYNATSGSGDVRIDLGFVLNQGESFALFATSGRPDSYISAMSVSAVPLPAGVLLMLTGLGGLAVARRRKTTAKA